MLKDRKLLEGLLKRPQNGSLDLVIKYPLFVSVNLLFPLFD